MFFLLIQLDLVTQIKNGAIDAHAHIAGAEDGIRDALTRYTTAVSGAYYFGLILVFGEPLKTTDLPAMLL